MAARQGPVASPLTLQPSQPLSTKRGFSLKGLDGKEIVTARSSARNHHRCGRSDSDHYNPTGFPGRCGGYCLRVSSRYRQFGRRLPFQGFRNDYGHPHDRLPQGISVTATGQNPTIFTVTMNEPDGLSNFATAELLIGESTSPQTLATSQLIRKVV